MTTPALSRPARLLPFILLLYPGTHHALTDAKVNDLSPPIGQADSPVSCSTKIQERFERAFMMLHHMMYAQAEREFRSIVASEPDCAMAQLGGAMTLFHPLWPGEPTEADLQQDSQAIEMARSLPPPAGREQAYIIAAGTNYSDWGNKSHPERIASILLMEEAARLEESVDKNPVTPGSVLPARELLEEMLLLSGDPGQAIKVFETCLETAPNRFNSIYGAGLASQRTGDSESAKSYYDRLFNSAPGLTVTGLSLCMHTCFLPQG